MKKKLKVVVLSGGKSSERKISLLSGKEVLNNINKRKYLAALLVIPKSGNKWVNRLMALKPDVVFIALHGTNGEDGSIQGLLETIGIPYTGAGVLSSALGMDKILFKKVMRENKIAVPRDVKNPPCFVKPNNQGSSMGASIALNHKEYVSAVKLAKKYSNDILIEEYLKGTELTCAVVGNEKPIALPVMEVRPLKSDFFDYDSKYTESGSEEIVPAGISKSASRKVQKISIEVYRTIGCRGFGRIDFILKNGRPVVLEINTIPGLTKMSLVPKAAKAAGISYSRLIDTIIAYAIKKQ
jgi:D-alanine-D-alanine ligase